MDHLDGAHNRFKSLIQPIKDLASNWDIDIAEGLHDYLEELESLRISLDGGQTQLNFAEAALLIQGSTAIYSKKVEYLHQLVLKSLEYITNKKASSKEGNNNKDKTGAGGGESGGVDEEDFLDFGSDPSFLLLDHVVEAGQNIDLKPVHNTNNNADGNKNRYSTESGRNSNNATNLSRVSISLMHSMLTEDHGTASLKLASSFMDSNGALLLGGFRPSFAKPSAALDRSLADVSAIGMTNMSREEHHMNMSHILPDHERYDDTQWNTTTAAGAVHDAGSGAEPMALADDYYDAGVGGGDDYMDYGDNDHDHHAMDTEATSATASASDHADTVTGTAGPSTTHTLPPRPLSPPRTHTTTNNAKKNIVLPQQRTYVMLDPHVVVQGSRPARKGRPYRIPTALRDKDYELDYGQCILQSLASTTGSGSGTAAQSRNPLKDFLDNSWPSRGLSDSSLVPLLKLKRKLHRKRLQEARESGDFEYIANQSMSRQLWEEPQEGVDDLPIVERGAGLGEGLGEGEMMMNLHVRERGSDGEPQTQDDQEMEIMYGANDYGDVEYDVGIHDDENYAIAGGMNAAPEGDLYFTEEELARRVDAALSEDLHRNNGQSYEMICKQYIEGFNRGANAFARETQLSKRVTDWTLRLEPILQAQEDATPFDIHEYSSRVLTTVDHVIHEHQEEKVSKSVTPDPDKVSFSEVVEGQSSAEVCRIFLACLQLANLGNVVVESNIAKDGSVTRNDFGLRLITTSKKQDIENFRAPSVKPLGEVEEEEEEDDIILAENKVVVAPAAKSSKGKGKGKLGGKASAKSKYAEERKRQLETV